MKREYMSYVNIACKEGMKPEEVQYLFNDIYKKTDTKQGKKMLRIFAKGIAKAKKNSLTYQNQPKQVEMQPQNIQEKSRQFVYK